jgi:hypothetical protein
MAPKPFFFLKPAAPSFLPAQRPFSCASSSNKPSPLSIFPHVSSLCFSCTCAGVWGLPWRPPPWSPLRRAAMAELALASCSSWAWVPILSLLPSAGSSPAAMDAHAGKRWNSRSLWFGWSSASPCAQPPQLGALAAGEQQLPIHGTAAIFPFLPLGQPWRSASDPSSSHRSSRACPTSPRCVAPRRNVAVPAAPTPSLASSLLALRACHVFGDLSKWGVEQ